MSAPSSPQPLPQLHEKETFPQKDHVQTYSVTVPANEAENLIASMENRVMGRVKNSTGWLELPRDAAEGGQFRFRPRMMRLDLEEQTVTCLGYYYTDESNWLVQVRFLADRPAGQPVLFEITSHFNPENPSPIPLLS